MCKYFLFCFFFGMIHSFFQHGLYFCDRNLKYHYILLKKYLIIIHYIPQYHKTCSKTDRVSSMNFMPNFDQPTKINLAMLSVCLVYLIFNALKVCKVWCLEIQKQIHSSTISCYFSFVFIVKSSTKFRL